MKKRLLAAPACLLLTLSLSACADSNPGPDPTDTYYNPAIDGAVDQQIAQSTAEAAQSLKLLNLTERARGPAPAPELDVSRVPSDLLVKVTEINWSGPVEPLVEELANKAGYGFTPPMHRPTTPVLVTMSSAQTTVAHALEDIGLQVDKQATIIVDPNKKTVALRYDDEDQHIDARSAAPRHGAAGKHRGRRPAAPAGGPNGAGGAPGAGPAGGPGGY
ncbi:DotD/TraH family lipoprotein [Gluconobacter cerinus]